MRKRGSVIATFIGFAGITIARVTGPLFKHLPHQYGVLALFGFLVLFGAGGPLLLLYLTKNDPDA